MGDAGTTQSAGVAGARRRREALRHAMLVLEEAAARPSGEGMHWCEHLDEALGRAHATIEEHIEETEAPGGLYDELVVGHERLHNRTQALRDEHPELLKAVMTLRERCGRDESPEALREGVLDLLSKLARHRSRGADLLHEAYNVDVSVGD